MLLGSCAPLTSPQTSLDLQHHPLDCRRFEQIYASSQLTDDLTGGEPSGGAFSAHAAPSAKPRLSASTAAGRSNFAREGNARPGASEHDTENILILSGGAEWGAYGSGFLNGLYGGQRLASNDETLRLRDFNRVTGISTGAIMATYTWAAIAQDRNHPDDPSNVWLEKLHAIYTYSDKDLFVREWPQIGYEVFSNGLLNPAGRLATKVEQGATDAWPTLQADRTTRVSVGSVNVLDGQFHTFDLVLMVGETPDRALSCYREAILASSAIPLAFPPRFIDGEPFYDGGIQFLVYLDNLVDWMRTRERPPSHVNIRIIVNGNQSPNDPGSDVQQADDCDHVTVRARPNCAPVANNLLGLEGSAKGLIPRVAEDVMVYQLKKDSVYRIYNDWLNMIRDSNGQIHGTFRVTYIPNSQLRDSTSVGGSATPCEKPEGSTLEFDPVFEKCLYDIGVAKGRAGHWDFESPPM